MKHTPAPWKVTKSNGLPTVTQVSLPYFAMITMADWQDYETMQANAERIVECVNALEGIEFPVAYIEASKIAIRERKELQEKLDNALAEIARMKQRQHDKLMEHPSYSSSENKTGIHRY